MANRPTVGGSDGTWGTELNEHLDVSLDTDGKVDDGAAQTTSAAPSADAEIANKKYVDDEITTAIAAAIGVAGQWHHDGRQIYAVNAPTSFTDFDLSSYVGSNYALVYLKVRNNSGSSRKYWFRENGETEDFKDPAGGVSTTEVGANGKFEYIIVETDSSGIFEWKCSSAADTNLWIKGYIR